MAKPIRQLSNVNITIQKGLAASEIFEQLDHDNENDEGSQTSTISGNIEFKNVSFAYDNSQNVLDNINLSIKENETIAIVGKSGSGKTSLANLIPRFYDHSSGEILIDNIPVRRLFIRLS